MLKSLALKLLSKLVDADSVQWVVNDIGELGVSIGSSQFYFYKGRSLCYDKHEDSEGPYLYRPVYKREFGEVIHSSQWQGSRSAFIATGDFVK